MKGIEKESQEIKDKLFNLQSEGKNLSKIKDEVVNVYDKEEEHIKSLQGYQSLMETQIRKIVESNTLQFNDNNNYDIDVKSSKK